MIGLVDLCASCLWLILGFCVLRCLMKTLDVLVNQYPLECFLFSEAYLKLIVLLAFVVEVYVWLA